MTEDKKMQLIKEMGVEIETECPDNDYGLKAFKLCSGIIDCAECWIKALED